MHPNSERPAEADLDSLIEDITVDASDDDEQLGAFRQAFEDGVPLPADGFVIGEPVSVLSYAGHPYLSGEIESARLDLPALGLVPLRLENRGTWNPEEP